MKKIILSCFLALSTLSQAQIQTPAASAHATLTQTVGLTEVTVDYSRPNRRGREIVGNLVPYGKIWRTGANATTKFT
ncbi:MAG TPA: dihydrolipoamide dehydrogenase, partial [Leeuwenhoekiella sp.]|nr:dihydrolipoamide dehydrogenase [Leeuwenhoekiella sp.]